MHSDLQVQPRIKMASVAPRRRIGWIFRILVIWMMEVGFSLASECNHGDFIPDTFDCSIFYRCDNGRLHRFVCPENLQWNQKILTCDWPRNVRCNAGKYDVVVVDIDPRIQAAETTKKQYRAGGDQFKVLCYYTPPSKYEHNEGDLSIEDIDITLCSHVIFDSAVLDEEKMQISYPAEWGAEALKHQVRHLKSQNRNLRVLLRVGRWDYGQEEFSKVSSNERRRKTFAANTARFLRSNGFDGLDLNWEYPVCWQGECDPSKMHENEHYAMLMRDLKEKFDANPRLILAASLPSCQKLIRVSFDRHALIECLDFITITTYRTHEHWKRQEDIGLYSRPNDRNLCLTSNCTMHWLAQMDIPREKLIMSITTHGLLYAMLNKKPPEESEPVKIPYSKVCELLEDPTWNVMGNQNSLTGPSASNGQMWVSFNNPASVSIDARSVIQGHFGGVAIETINSDDHRGTCRQKPFPLLSSVKKTLMKE